jgi:hypothetical protein
MGGKLPWIGRETTELQACVDFSFQTAEMFGRVQSCPGNAWFASGREMTDTLDAEGERRGRDCTETLSNIMEKPPLYLTDKTQSHMNLIGRDRPGARQ